MQPSLDAIRSAGNPVAPWPQFSVPISTVSYDIGEFTYFSPDLVLKTWISGERITIGKYCSIGEQVYIASGGNRRTDLAALFPFKFETYKTTRNTRIGHDVWIGARATISGGVTIGDGAVIANGAVVFTDVPAFAIAAGNPAQVMRYRFSEAVVTRLRRVAWWDWPMDRIMANQDWFYKPIAEFLREFDPEGDARDAQ